LISESALHSSLKRLKVRTFIYIRLQGNQNSIGLQYEVAYWPALAVGIAVQLAAVHYDCIAIEFCMKSVDVFLECFKIAILDVIAYNLRLSKIALSTI